MNEQYAGEWFHTPATGERTNTDTIGPVASSEPLTDTDARSMLIDLTPTDETTVHEAAMAEAPYAALMGEPVAGESRVST